MTASHSYFTDKVTSFDVNLERQLVMVETDSLSQDEVLDVIKKTGKEVAVASAQ